MGGALVAALAASGCRPERVLAEGSSGWWLGLPVVGFLLLTALLALLAPRRRGNEPASAARAAAPKRRWDRRLHRALLWSLGIAAVAAFAFAAVNLSVELEPTRKLLNIGLWFLGTMLGAAAALLVGERLAEPASKRTRMEVW
jgi:hypothetical protein